MADPPFDIHSFLFPFVFCIRYEGESYLNHNSVKHDLAVVKSDRWCAQGPSRLKTLTQSSVGETSGLLLIISTIQDISHLYCP